jgi:phenylalanyl-tRNA synthetase beta chain
VLDRDVPAERVADAIREIAPQILKQLSLFDVYTGEQVPSGKKSLAFSLMFQSDDRTLLSREVDAFMEKLVAHLRDRVGAELR